jgi:hypothetical protein
MPVEMWITVVEMMWITGVEMMWITGVEMMWIDADGACGHEIEFLIG